MTARLLSTDLDCGVCGGHVWYHGMVWWQCVLSFSCRRRFRCVGCADVEMEGCSLLLQRRLDSGEKNSSSSIG